MSFLRVMKAEIIRSFIIMRRYWFRTVTGMVIGYGMLMVLIAGFIYSRPGVEENLNKFDDPTAATNFVLGFIIGMFAFGVVGMFTQGLQGMAATGVLEQLCMSPHGLAVNFLAQTLVGSVASILSSGVMVYAVTWSVGGMLHWDTLPILALLALTFFNLVGFGFMVGGLVLVFKQVGQVAVILRMSLFGLAVFAREEILQQSQALSFFLHLLPITDATICLKYVLIKNQMTTVAMADGETVEVFQSVFLYPSFYWLILSCVLWTVIGWTVFKYMEDYSRSKGTLGSY
ncbi:MAG: ABC transporter permease, partial [Candidatus Hydrogenedentes bacterium]|nr:ABC transporter permease [Candidatus Hydrogenedentota bacterium]